MEDTALDGRPFWELLGFSKAELLKTLNIGMKNSAKFVSDKNSFDCRS